MPYRCNICEEVISEKVFDYSKQHFGKALCINHQKDVNHKKANSSKTTTQHNMSYYCNECKQTITYAELKYSIKNFDKPLCRGCQPVIEKTSSAPPTKPELLKPAGIEIGGKQPKKKIIHDGY